MLYVVYMANLTSYLNNNFNVGQNFCDKFENWGQLSKRIPYYKKLKNKPGKMLKIYWAKIATILVESLIMKTIQWFNYIEIITKINLLLIRVYKISI